MTPEQKAELEARIAADQAKLKQQPPEAKQPEAKTEPTTQPKVLSYAGGGAGFAFNINGSGFGSAPGQLTIGGQVVKATKWTDTQIKGVAPAGLKPGQVDVTLNGLTFKVTL